MALYCADFIARKLHVGVYRYVYVCVYLSPIVLLMETPPNPAFDEPFVSWTYMYLKGRRASLFFVRTTLMATLLHTAHALFVFGGKK